MKALVKPNANRTSQSDQDSWNERQLEPSSTSNQLLFSAFQTPLGWMGLLGRDQQLISVFVGHSSSKSMQKSAHAASLNTGSSIDESDWNPQLRCSLEAYAEGDIVDFSRVELLLPATTPFRRQIIIATRRLAYGETASYGELARRVGHPGAARAVGTVMSTNRFPILIPCHRVLAAGGKLGGYTSPAGTGLKQRLLDMESRFVR